MELIFLGTGSAYPSPHRGASCIVLRTGAEGCWMFDCGEGSQIQIMKSTIKPGKLSKIFITHLHGDHLFGLPGLLCTISQNFDEGRPPMDIYGPHGLCQYLRTSLSLSRSMMGFQYRVHELMTDIKPVDIDGIDWSPEYSPEGVCHLNELPPQQIYSNDQGIWEICTSGPFKVCAGLLKHRVVSFGYVIKEDDIPGKLLVEKLQKIGIPPGPLYGRIKKGEAITTPSGDIVTPNDVMGPTEPGRKVVILGDTCDSQGVARIAQDADILVHESTNENAHQSKCIENGHSTPGMAASFGLQVGARQLILTHFSQRYKASKDNLKEGEECVDKLVDEARCVFGPEVFGAEDFKVVPIPLHRT